jgi:hypothetical protein
MKRVRRLALLLVLGAWPVAAYAQPAEEAPAPLPPATSSTTAPSPSDGGVPAPGGPAPVDGGATQPADAGPAKLTGLPCLKSPDGCQIEDFKTPTSPAFAIIGVTPSQVETPRSPKDLGLALYNAYSGGSLGQDVAIDVAPYWLIARPELTYDEYVRPSPLRQLLQNLSASVATAAVPEQSATDIGLGLRTHVLFVDTSDVEADEKRTQAESELFAIQGAEAAKTLYELQGCDKTPDTKLCRDLREKLKKISEAEQKLKDATKAVQDVLAVRSGFSIGLAGAVAFRSAADQFKPNDFQRAAGWANVGYRSKLIELAGLVRFTTVDGEQRLQFIDLGARVGVFRPTWGVNGEAIYRAVSGDAPAVKNSARLAGTFEFKVADEIFISATYGKEADNETKTGKTFALFGLSLQAGKRKLAQP